jgi:hypothetical protein
MERGKARVFGRSRAHHPGNLLLMSFFYLSLFYRLSHRPSHRPES